MGNRAPIFTVIGGTAPKEKRPPIQVPEMHCGRDGCDETATGISIVDYRPGWFAWVFTCDDHRGPFSEELRRG